MKYDKRPWYLRVLSVKRFSPASDKDPGEGLNTE